MADTDKRETAKDRPFQPEKIRCEGCDTLVDALNPNCRCFRG